MGTSTPQRACKDQRTNGMIQLSLSTVWSQESNSGYQAWQSATSTPCSVLSPAQFFRFLKRGSHTRIKIHSRRKLPPLQLLAIMARLDWSSRQE